jgi:hypothetical protein
MEFIVQDAYGQRFIEGAVGQQLIKRMEDVTTVLEACFENAVYPMCMTFTVVRPQLTHRGQGVSAPVEG